MPDDRPSKLTVRRLTPADLPDVVRIHREAFPYSAITRLGDGAIERYYRWLLTGPHDAYCIGAFDSITMAGFNFAGIFRGAMSGFLRRNWLYLGFNALRRPALLKVPGIGRKLWTAARSLIGAAGSHKPRGCGSEAVSRQKRFGVLAIAVAAKYRGLAGAPLMAAAEEYARASGFGECGLSVAVDNHRAVRFYLKLGWEKELEEGTWKGRMRKRLSEGVLERA